MQNGITHRLAKKLRSYAVLHGFRAAARKYKILDPHGRPSPGMVKLLIDGYEPRRHSTRLRLHLYRRTINDHLAKDTLTEMPPALLRYALEHREEFSCEVKQ